jgi:hypothetical protein
MATVRWGAGLEKAVGRTFGWTVGVAASLLIPSTGAAFELKHAPGGQEVRWNAPSVAFVIDPSVDAAAPGGSDGAGAAVAAWSGVSGAPMLSSSAGPGGGGPAFDGKNTIVYMPRGYAPAGGALAVTVSTIDDSTGYLLDTDIVINGVHRFAVLSPGAIDPRVAPTPTDGSGNGDDDGNGHGDDDGNGDGDGERSAFDLQHVVTHEVGHALGLGDVHDDASAVMYAMSAAGSAAGRAPSSDDAAGLETLYAGTLSADAASKSGCGQGAVAGTHARAGDVWFGFAVFALAAAGLASRQRTRGMTPARSKTGRAPVLLGVIVLAAALDAGVSPALDAQAPAPAQLSVRVVGASTTQVGPALQTRLELAPAVCDVASAACDQRLLEIVMWGGTRGGITQRIGGARVPKVGDTLDVTKGQDGEWLVAGRLGS